jgi:hypothetical protein
VTENSAPSVGAVACKAVPSIDAGRVVDAEIFEAFVLVDLASLPAEPVRTNAAMGVQCIHAFAVVLACLFQAVID